MSRQILDPLEFSYYDNEMSSEGTMNGKPVSDEQIQAWADEAERGYDVEEMKARGRGRPGRGAAPSQVVALRLTTEELEAVDAIAAREHKSRSEIIREAIAQHAA